LFKDRNPNFKKGHFQWRKNNSLVAGRINKIFDAEDQLIDLSFEKLNELHPFPGLFDCELEPDYIDGGHGLQDPRLFISTGKLQLMFNSRRQNSEPFIPCDQNPYRGIFSGNVFPGANRVEVRDSELLKFSGSAKVERNWISLEDPKKDLLIYSIFPTLRILENKSGELTIFEELDTRMNFENTFRDIAKAANTTAHNAKLTIELHGSSPVLKIGETLLGVLHCHYSGSDSGTRIYQNYFFKMNPVTFTVVASALKPLPLTYEIDARFGRLNRDKWYYAANYPSKNRIAFVSDMTLDGDELLIAYGVGDAESRIYVINTKDIDHYF